MMNGLKIATWNVNSLRVRLPHVLNWLSQMKPDVLALQELKLPDADFPFEAIRAAGYQAIVSGQKTYNGVATLIREELVSQLGANEVRDIPGFEDHQRRLLGITVNGIRILNVYVPNGENVESDKYQYKLMWLKHLAFYLEVELKKYPKTILLGDFNIAPADSDVHDPVEWAGHVLCSEPERAAFQTLIQLGFHDVFRELFPQAKKFSWWDYRLNAFKRNRGLRIDLILVSEALLGLATHVDIDVEPRAADRPSDHAPVSLVMSGM